MSTDKEMADWDLRQKLKNPFNGLRFFRKTNVPGSILAVGRHWPHLLCWSWAIWLYGPKADKSYRLPIGIHGYYCGRMPWHVNIRLGLFGVVLMTQSTGHYPSITAKNNGAPDFSGQNSDLNKLLHKATYSSKL